MARRKTFISLPVLALTGTVFGACVQVDKEVGSAGADGSGDSEGEVSAALSEPPEQLWSQDDPGMEVGSVALNDAGEVFIAGAIPMVVGTNEGVAVLSRLSSSDGAVLWSQTLAGPLDFYSIRIESFEGDVIVVWAGSQAPPNAARYSNDGSLIWSNEVPIDIAGWISSMTVHPDGVVAFAGRSAITFEDERHGFVATIDAKTGVPGWAWSSSGAVEDATALGYLGDGSLTVAIKDSSIETAESYVVTLDSNGAETPSFALPTEPTPTAARGIVSHEGGPTLMVGSTNQTSWLALVEDGALGWQWTNLADEQMVWNMAFEAAAVQGGFIVAGKVIEDPAAPLQGWLRGIGEDGTLLWSMTQVPGISLAVGDNLIVTGARQRVEARSF